MKIITSFLESKIAELR